MTDYDKIDKCKWLLMTKFFEPKKNELAIEISLGIVSKQKEDLFISGINLGSANSIDFDNNNDTFIIYFDSYISYFIVNESYSTAATDNFSGNSIREYKNSAFINFCKAETIGFELNQDKVIRHYEIVTIRHVINILTISQPRIKRII